MRYTFGPVNSRRFGLSLGIDLSPDKKSCNFDCIYCELKPAKPVAKIENPPKVEDVLAEVKESLKRYPNIDVITVTANGEPTLYGDLDALIDGLDKIKGEKKTLILSNASTITKEDIRQTLKKIDTVKLSLDCASQRCFKKIDRPLKGIEIEDIIKGIKEFSTLYDKTLVIEILVVKGINDKEEEFERLNRVLKDIKPDRVDLGTIDRPPAYKVEPVDYERLFELSKLIKNIPVSIAARRKDDFAPLFLSKNEILNLLAHRPLSKDDVGVLFDKKSLENLNALIEEKKVILDQSGVGEFFKISLDK